MSSSLAVTVQGANFAPDSQVQWNGADRPTTYVSATALQVDVTVVSPAPGGGVSNTVAFTIDAVGDNLVTALTSLTLANNGEYLHRHTDGQWLCGSLAGALEWGWPADHARRHNTTHSHAVD